MYACSVQSHLNTCKVFECKGYGHRGKCVYCYVFFVSLLHVSILYLFKLLFQKTFMFGGVCAFIATYYYNLSVPLGGTEKLISFLNHRCSFLYSFRFTKFYKFLFYPYQKSLEFHLFLFNLSNLNHQLKSFIIRYVDVHVLSKYQFFLCFLIIFIFTIFLFLFPL